ncbi:C-3',4' desaturase CrtD [Limnothrix sp. FACHB-1083]|uniref:C-3',4' desaturase CrtD n=1 Tax=unclassified Limnothrix TaxID=2632864 RepID=UPI001680F708|nr:MULTISPECIES: C-3',4' desaturase CrtD [unclassified Limnothrix]MBD2162669.1 C-3',4' desaturase CrtD [Limnothrix sp. FACHB-1083]MBD2193741.1 C-3',4' desaturase CrtD [Limnothrix sp. FACHB-1088]
MTQPTATAANRPIVVIGAGIGGLTTAALLARRGRSVKVFDLAIVPGGCASTFRRRGFTFEVGATQVAGLEPGGIHHRIFGELGIELPAATPCDPACAVFLPGETEPISVWRDPDRWRAERSRQFPGSEPFWRLLADLFRYSWEFQAGDPVLPPGNAWDVVQLLKAVKPSTLLTAPHAFSTVGDLLQRLGLAGDRRLKTFLDMQLKLYSQVGADETALLYAATALGLSQEPFGLYHLEGSMQVLSDRLLESLTRDGGQLQMRHRVERIITEHGQTTGVMVRNLKTDETWVEPAAAVVANVPIQNLIEMVDWPSDRPWFDRLTTDFYRSRAEKLPEPSGAFVVYLGVDRAALPADCPPHLQFLYDWDGPVGENNSLFVSVSREGDGRAPAGMATITASSFVDPQPWYRCRDRAEYEALKTRYTEEAIGKLGRYFQLDPGAIVHCEAATPRTFEDFTGRKFGYVGGLGMRVSTFGPFAIGNRTPVPGLWLVGDSTHPGEGTAGTSYSALTTVRQMTAAGF